MNPRTTVLVLALTLLPAAVVFHFFQSRLAGPLFAFGALPEVVTLLEQSLDDQRRLARADPEHAADYRGRFDRTRDLVHNLQILEHGRAGVERRYTQILLLLFGGAFALVAAGVAVRHGRHETRLRRLQTALGELAAGRMDIEIGDRRRDAIGRIATMIEETSRLMARDRRRLKALQNLSAWQESARRHAHEMRTPLTGARLELERLSSLLSKEPLKRPAEVRGATESALQELERLGRFTQDFTSFARLPQPRLAGHDLARLVEEFVATYETAWQNLRFRVDREPGPLTAALDRDMVRQVLVNLCDNSSLALAGRDGTMTFSLRNSGEHAILDVADDGPGIDETVRGRLFEPYTTTRSIGEGMGLGLAISKKILLEHDGDLELVASSTAGTVFRLTFHQNRPEDDP